MVYFIDYSDRSSGMYRDEVNLTNEDHLQLSSSDHELVLFLARCSLARKPGDNNWLEEKAVGGLP